MHKCSRLVCLLALLAGACREPDREGVIATELRAALEGGAEADVIIDLRDSAAIERVASGLGETLRISHRYSSIGALAGRITPQALERLRHDPAVAHVRRPAALSGQLLEAVPAAGVERARSVFGLTGRGVRVVVFDSGVDGEHPDLQGAIVAEHCFTRGACAPWNANEGTLAEDDHGHGTAVAGVIASRGVQGPRGFAPEAELISLKVHNADNRGSEMDWLSAVEWIYKNRSALEIAVVNMSGATDVLYADVEECESEHGALARGIHQLIEAGVTVVAAGGNLGSTTKLPAPACISGVIAVGATYDADVGAAPPTGQNFQQALGASFAPCRDETTQAGQIACYNNTSPRLDLVIPGGPMLTLQRGGGTRTAWGTSQSAAALSGVAALLRQCNPTLRPAGLAETLRATGETRKDARSGREFPYVRAADAALAACPDLRVPDTGPDNGPDNGPSTTPASPSGEAGAVAGSAGRTPAADSGGSGEPATQPPLRDGSALQGRYEGPAPARALEQHRLRSAQTSSAVQASPEGTPPRTERVSSCSAAGPGGSVAPLWLLGFALLACRLRNSPRCRCPTRRCGCLAARRKRHR